MTALFVTGTGTGIGKTFVTAGLVRALRAQGKPVAVVKPVISGFELETAQDSDTGLLLSALGKPIDPAGLDRVSPWRFRAPLSPDMAAAAEGRAVDFAALVDFTRYAIAGTAATALIEGVGGVMVPLDDRHTVLDWIAASGVPALLVAGSYLGTLSHTLTALGALAQRNVPVAAVIVSESADSGVALAPTIVTLRRFCGATPILDVKRSPGEDAALHDLAGSLGL